MGRSILAVVTLLAAACLGHASLVYPNQSLVTFGSGLGSQTTIVTVQDSVNPDGEPVGGGNGIEGGCVSATATGTVSFDCVGGTGVTEQDNQAINNLVLFSDIGYSSGDNIGAVVNISETGQDLTVTITAIYLIFYGENDDEIHTAIYSGSPLTLTQGTGTGLGGSGFVFILDNEQRQFIADNAGSIVKIGGGVQFGGQSTNDGLETLYVQAIPCEGEDCEGDPGGVPEPATMMMIGGGLAGLGLVRRFRRS